MYAFRTHEALPVITKSAIRGDTAFHSDLSTKPTHIRIILAMVIPHVERMTLDGSGSHPAHAHMEKIGHSGRYRLSL